MTTLYRPHRGHLSDSMAEVIELADFNALINHLQQEYLDMGLTPMPHRDNVVVKPYCWDERIKWDTYIVTIDGNAVGFTNGALT